jgi:hypothetical protein
MWSAVGWSRIGENRWKPLFHKQDQEAMPLSGRTMRDFRPGA